MSETIEAPARPAEANNLGGDRAPPPGGRTYENRNPAPPSPTTSVCNRWSMLRPRRRPFLTVLT